jgi:hypothetical protein
MLLNELGTRNHCPRDPQRNACFYSGDLSLSLSAELQRAIFKNVRRSLVEQRDWAPGMGWLGEAIATRGAKALHRVRIDEVMRGPELVDALLEGLGAFMAPVG